LYVVATPLGNLADITHRAVETLSQVQWIAAEDTRHSRPLLQSYGVRAQCIAYHEHNEREALAAIIDKLVRGESVALISDAGTPLISDPGFPLVREARRQGLAVVPVPGPCAMIAALSVSGLPTDRFVFEGFLPARAQARVQRLKQLGRETRTLAFYESTHRIVDCVTDMAAVFGGEREAVIARELTKTFETVHADRLAALVDWLTADANQQKGEFVILVQGAPAEAGAIDADAENVLRLLCEELPPARAASLAARITGLKRNDLYALAVKMSHHGSS
jgi:16S rRNA (cytidine1402-2'-O)-methyltransferase